MKRSIFDYRSFPIIFGLFQVVLFALAITTGHYPQAFLAVLVGMYCAWRVVRTPTGAPP